MSEWALWAAVGALIAGMCVFMAGLRIHWHRLEYEERERMHREKMDAFRRMTEYVEDCTRRGVRI